MSVGTLKTRSHFTEVLWGRSPDSELPIGFINSRRQILGHAQELSKSRSLRYGKAGQVQVIARSSIHPRIGWNELTVIEGSSRQFWLQSVRTPLPTTTSKATLFMAVALVLIERGMTEPALEGVYDGVHELLDEGRFDVVSQLMKDAEITSTNLDVQIGLLSSSRPWRTAIPEWNRFHTRLASFLSSIEEDPNKTLPGI